MSTAAVESLTGPTGRIVAARRGEIRRVLRRHGVTNVRLFGSVARGEDHAGSDVDLLVDLPPGIGLFGIASIEAELEELLGVGVDLVPAAALKERVRATVEPDLVRL